MSCSVPNPDSEVIGAGFEILISSYLIISVDIGGT